MEERIALDKATRKALAAESRVRILKLLDQKSRTQSDIAHDMRMSMPTIGEHLKSLVDAGLISREETTRKWKYYFVTQKTRLLLHPHTGTIWFVLGLFLFSAAAMVMSAIKFFTPLPFPAQMAVVAEAETRVLSGDVLVAGPSPLWLIVFGIATAILLIALITILYRHGWLGSSLSNKKNI